MKRYRFVSATTLAPTAEAVRKAVVIDDDLANLELSEGIAPYVFEESAKLTEIGRKATEIKVTEDTLQDGQTPINRVSATINGKVYRWRFYGAGSKNTIPAMSLSAKEIEKVKVGYCKTGEEFVTEEKFDATTGEVKRAKVIYLTLS
jgi:hypothetical protein